MNIAINHYISWVLFICIPVNLIGQTQNKHIQFDILGKSEGDSCGAAVSVSGDGFTVAIGSPGTKNLNLSKSGEVNVYTISKSGLTMKGSTIYGKTNHKNFGISLALSANGNTMIVGIPNSTNNNGEVNIYEWQDNSWRPKGNPIYGKEKNERAGLKTCISDDGNTIAFLGQHFIEIYLWSNEQWVLLSSSYYNNPCDVALSPSGKHMAFCSIEHDQNYIRVIELLHSNWQQKGSAITEEHSSLRFHNSEQKLLINTDDGLVQYVHSGNSWKRSSVKPSIDHYNCLEAESSSSDCSVFAIGLPNCSIKLGKDSIPNIGGHRYLSKNR